MIINRTIKVTLTADQANQILNALELVSEGEDTSYGYKDSYSCALAELSRKFGNAERREVRKEMKK